MCIGTEVSLDCILLSLTGTFRIGGADLAAQVKAEYSEEYDEGENPRWKAGDCRWDLQLTYLDIRRTRISETAPLRVQRDMRAFAWHL